MKAKKFILVSAAVIVGVISGFLISEIILRFYLFGFTLHFRDNRVIDKRLFLNNKNKIFFVGDSFTQGYPFPVHQSYPILLEDKIGNRNIKITNFALRSTDMYDQINVIKQIITLEPSIIVWGLSANDIYIPKGQIQRLDKLDDRKSALFPIKKESAWHSVRRMFILLPYDCFVRAKMSFFSTVKEILVNYSCLYNFVRSRIVDCKGLEGLRSRGNLTANQDILVAGTLAYYRKDKHDFRHIFKALKHTKYLLRRKNTELIVLFIPEEPDVNEKLFENNLIQANAALDGYDRTMPGRLIGRFCADSHIFYINPADAMARAVESGKRLFMKFDRHYNYEGNAFLAGFLAKNGLFLSLVAKYCYFS